MPERITDNVAESVLRVIESIDMLAVARDRIKWEVFPVLAVDPRRPSERQVAYMIGIGMRIPVTGDHVVNYDAVTDPYDFTEISSQVRKLFAAAGEDADRAAADARKMANGHRESPGGLILP